MLENFSVDPSELLSAQRALRDRLLGAPASSDRRPLRELAAEMLLYLDQPDACWQAGVDWLLQRTSADRVDAGFCSATHARYRPGIERVRAHARTPSVLGADMDAQDPGITIVWSTRRVVVFDDIAADPRFGSVMRRSLLAANTRRKLAVALHDGAHDVGLLCVDSTRGDTAWSVDECLLVDRVAHDIVGPILGASRRLGATEARALAQAEAAVADGAPPSSVRGLTPAELRVARLVLAGMSYKEIAQALDRSAATIDHQLRSMRQKLGVRSTAKLVRELAGLVQPEAMPARPAPPPR